MEPNKDIVEDVRSPYIVTDPDEEKWLMSALNEPNPILTESEVDKMLEK